MAGRRPRRTRSRSQFWACCCWWYAWGRPCWRAATWRSSVATGAAPSGWRRNLAQQRGDRRGAFRLAVFVFSVLMLLWLTRGHLAMSFGTFGTFLIALCTSVFYGVVIWMVYIALEPYVRRRWPQTLISWSSVLIGRVRDPVVGRDVLIGAAAGSGVLLVGALVDFWRRHLVPWTPNLDS